MQEPFHTDELYALRRILVKRLQAASRGVPRRVRFQAQQDFIREWDEARRNGTWGTLAQTLHAPHRASVPQGFLDRLARGEGLAPDRLAPIRPKLACSPPGRRAPQDTPKLQTLARDEGRIGFQEELFGSELILQPL